LAVFDWLVSALVVEIGLPLAGLLARMQAMGLDGIIKSTVCRLCIDIDESVIEPYLQTRVGQMTTRLRSGGAAPMPPMAEGAYHLIISSEHLQAEPMIQRLLAIMRAALMPGGKLFFSAPFDAGAATSRAARAGAPGVLGWDILNILERAGFDSAAAHLFWSEEFGHLGPFNLIFSASV